jgi:hypothetical protein
MNYFICKFMKIKIMRNINSNYFYDREKTYLEINFVKKLFKRSLLNNIQQELDFFINEEREENFFKNISNNIMVFSNIIRN